jgi:hypothetical protein
MTIVNSGPRNLSLYVDAPRQRELSADLIENIEYFIKTEMYSSKIFHEDDMHHLTYYIRRTLDVLLTDGLIDIRRRDEFKFFIKILSYGSDFNFVVMVIDYDHQYNIFNK